MAKKNVGMTYCVSCKTRTANLNPRESTTANGRKQLKSTCAICNSKKSTFMKGGFIGPLIGMLAKGFLG